MLRLGREPGKAWLPSDVMLALALTEYEAGLCDGCGQPMHQSMDPETEGRWVAPPPARCHACTAIEHRSADYGQNEAPRALRFSAALKAPRVKPTKRVEPAKRGRPRDERGRFVSAASASPLVSA